MAQRVQVQLIDDLNGQEAQETIRFALDGIRYEIDLTTSNATQLRSALSEYVDNGRKAGISRQGQSTPVGKTASRKRERTQQIRDWAKKNGHNPGVRGRIPYTILDAYSKANE